MPRGLAVIIVLVALIGGAIALSTRVKEQPTHTIEADVTTNAG